MIDKQLLEFLLWLPFIVVVAWVIRRHNRLRGCLSSRRTGRRSVPRVTVWAIIESPDGWWERVHSLYMTQAHATIALNELWFKERGELLRVEELDVLP